MQKIIKAKTPCDVVDIKDIIYNPQHIYVLKQAERHGILHQYNDGTFMFVMIDKNNDRWGGGIYKDMKSLFNIFLDRPGDEIFVFKNKQEFGEWLAKQ